ncbi:type II secretion system protein [Neobacillus sp. SM06]|uniref:type II secretion system protein n=1 Tax=Neobacillus sp. SM06 TaxID=3422492 RepID=UPI003D26EE48
MLKYMKQNSGYTLLTVLVIFTVVSIIGLTLAGLTANSLKFVSTSKTSIEEKASAEMAIDEAMAQIDNLIAAVNSAISSNQLPPESIQAQVQASLNQVKSLGAHPFTLTHAPKNTANGVYVEHVTIKAPIGKSGKSITKTLDLSTVSEVFHYGVVTPGDLVLYGTPYIEGNVLVGGNLNTFNFFGFPSVKGNLTVKGKYYTGFLGLTEYFPDENNLKKYFAIPPVVQQWQDTVIPSIDVLHAIQTKSTPIKTSMTISKLKDVSRYPNEAGYFIDSNLKVKKNESYTINGNLVVAGNLQMEEGSTLTINGSLMVYGTADLSGTLTFSENNYLYVKNYATLSNLTLKGPIYADDFVEIKDSINSNGTIYIRKGAQLSDFRADTERQTVIVASDGPITLFFSNSDRENPKVMNAFFYTNSSLNMLGFLSNVKIVGGIYGNPINLAALNDTNSRLSIVYNQDMLKNLPLGIPTAAKITKKELNTIYGK